MAHLLSKELRRKIENKYLKLAIWPLCRAYARILGDRPADSFYRFLCSFQFWHVHRFWPDFIQPRFFSEKLWSRMLHSRDPLLTLACDKLEVRQYVADKAGEECLIPLLWSGGDPGKILFDKLPNQFVMKTNHGCGYNIIVTDKAKLNLDDAKLRLQAWLKKNFGLNSFLGAAWGYKNIKPNILVESFIGEKDNPPADYKFYCFSGRVEALTLHFGRYERHETKAFGRDFKPLEFSPGFPQYQGSIQQPANYDMMLRLAESLAADFDFIRVDLYNTGGKVYFGELTPYPAGVTAFRGLDLKVLDAPMGEKWIWHDPR